MLDRKFILENIDLIKTNCARRGVEVDLGQLVSLEEQRRQKQAETEELNRRANEASKAIGKATGDQEKEACKDEGRELRRQKDALQGEVQQLEESIYQIQSTIPNLSHPEAPVGTDEEANLELQKGATPIRTLDFQPLDHVQLGEQLDLFDFDAGGKVAGHGFYYLKNDAVLLELALQHFALNFLIKKNFVPMITPDLARTEILQGVGFIPRGPETQIYSVAQSDLNLIATAEITLGGMYADVVLQADELPIRMCGISHCYRTEAGAAGRASRGLYRVHQFTKVEMFALTLPSDSEATLEELRGLECDIFDALGIPFRVVDTATGDLGGPAYRKYDLEAWMPGRGEGGTFGEVTSTSNCTDYQARRLKIRYKEKGKKGTHYVHTLNGTAVAISRALIAILENYQQADGSVIVPDVLRPLMGKDLITPNTSV
ncbi:MAG TPA: serine--tRNA ligase [Pirellulales bacterium]|jgi:seryl-tRNA synthetase|nr:serine--tRNA ligase [Pirellulales bacterium]|tara:strand:+ start:207 stop:1499 length:1293 start_codon:yes stop_codon:yes gene_type:complete